MNIWRTENLFGISSRRKIPKLRYERAPLTAATRRKVSKHRKKNLISKSEIFRLVLLCYFLLLTDKRVFMKHFFTHQTAHTGIHKST